MVVAAALGVQAPLARAATPAPPAEHAQSSAAERAAAKVDVDQLVAELESDRYLIREEATQQLVVLGERVFDRLLALANGQKPEAADRAIWILQQGALSSDEHLQREALTRLVQIEGRPTLVSQAAVTLADANHRLALAQIPAAGGKILEPGFDAVFRHQEPRRILLDENWQGGDEGLRHVAAVQDVQLVFIKGVHVSHEALKQLADMPNLLRLRLYDVGLSQDDATQLRAELRGVEIDFRQGALLGIGSQANDGTIPASNQLPNAAVVGHVRPNTAAARAGLQAGDVILKIDDEDVTSFKSLTDLISKYAAGDEATLLIQRGEKSFPQKVTFGSW